MIWQLDMHSNRTPNTWAVATTRQKQKSNNIKSLKFTFTVMCLSLVRLPVCSRCIEMHLVPELVFHRESGARKFKRNISFFYWLHFQNETHQTAEPVNVLTVAAEERNNEIFSLFGHVCVRACVCEFGRYENQFADRIENRWSHIFRLENLLKHCHTHTHTPKSKVNYGLAPKTKTTISLERLQFMMKTLP